MEHSPPSSRVTYGKEGFFQATADWIEGFDDWYLTGEEFLDAGDRVVVRVHQMARGTGSGVPVEGEFWFVFAISGRRIARWSIYARRGKALEAAGLGE